MATSRTIEIWRDPYGAGFNTTKARRIVFSSGVTVLVGCNGAGKTTLLHNIEDNLRNENIPCLFYSSKDEISKAFDKAIFHGNWEYAATARCSSEGEQITMALGDILPNLRTFIVTGTMPKSNPFASIFKSSTEDKPVIPKERWILFDAVDSGYSIDNIIELKNIFELMQKDAKANDIDLYIIVSTNAYEFANGNICLNVMSGKYITFKTYNAYKNFVLRTSKNKQKRYEDSNNS